MYFLFSSPKLLSFREHLKCYLKDLAAPLWLPGLAEQLVRESGLDSEGYSTSQWVGSVPPAKVWRVGPRGGIDLDFSVELLPSSVVERLSSNGAVFAEVSTIAPRLVGIERALMQLQRVPTLATSVGLLIKSIHVLEEPEPDFDISFSDPSIPFSVFLNISQGRFSDLRTAEALVHEAMHLQLSLIERLVPLAKTDQSLHYSPWKRTHRPAAGLMHALYVFRVIDEWLAHTPKTSDAEKKYAQKRRQEICEEIEQLAPESFFDDLTLEGQQLLSRLLPYPG